MRRFGLVLRKSLVVLLLVLLAGSAAWGLWHWRGSGDNAPRYRTEKVQRGRVASLINASGTVVPEEVVDVGAQVAGKVVRFNKDPDHSDKSIDYGSRVTEGLTLAWIDDSLYAPEVGTAEADVVVAEADLGAAEADLNKARAELRAAKAKEAQAIADYNRIKKQASGTAAQQEIDAAYAAAETAKAAVPASEASILRAEKG